MIGATTIPAIELRPGDYIEGLGRVTAVRLSHYGYVAARCEHGTRQYLTAEPVEVGRWAKAVG